jgi:hypothetical protein
MQSSGNIECNLDDVGLGESCELASLAGHSARQPPQLVLYAGKYFFGWKSSARSPTLLDRPTDVLDAELAHMGALIATAEIAHVIAHACIFATFDAALHPFPHRGRD